MVDISENDLNKALIQVYEKNKNDQQARQQKTSSQEEQKRAFEEAETEFLARKVFEPCAVKEICPFPLTKAQEDFLIPEFIRSPHGFMPTEHTMAMEGKPYTVLVQMENGLVYMAAISQVMTIHWPGGIQNEIHRKMEKASEGLICFNNQTKDWRPVILADSRQYHAQLYPMHLNKDIRQNDYLGVLWKSSDDITNPQTKAGYIFPAGGESFQYLTGDGLLISSIPPHILKILGQIQKIYDTARDEKKIGKPIYARFDPDKPMHRGWTLTIFPWEKRQYFNVPDVRYINPNRKSPIQIVHRSPRHALPFQQTKNKQKQNS